MKRNYSDIKRLILKGKHIPVVQPEVYAIMIRKKQIDDIKRELDKICDIVTKYIESVDNNRRDINLLAVRLNNLEQSLCVNPLEAM